VFGGLAAMLVAIPSAIAFGLIIVTPLAEKFPEAIPAGALLGILGTAVVGLIAPTFGGTPRLISAPCAPAAAVLAAFTAHVVESARDLNSVLLLIAMAAMVAGALQFAFGALGGGRLIKFVPYQVVAGYLSGVGIYIFLGQLPKALGVPKLGPALLHPETWKWPSIAVAGVTVILMVTAPKITKALPAAIIALLGGIATYFVVGWLAKPELLTLALPDGKSNPLVVGVVQASPVDVWNAFVGRLGGVTALDMAVLREAATPAIMLAVLLSIDTLKTCVVLDAVTRTRHDSNRELRGQGLGTLAAGLLGGMPGAGTMGATLVNLNSGGKTRLSSTLEGVFALAALLVLGPAIAWVPKAALAGILLVVAVRMVDLNTLRLLRQKSTVVDFVVVLAVIVVAIGVDLVAGAGVGVALAILLFLRDQIRGNVVRRRLFGDRVFSKKRRPPSEAAVLEREGKRTVVFELQGSLFFGTTDQLYTEVEPHLAGAKVVILDMRRVTGVDFTAAHTLELLEARIHEAGGTLAFADLPANLPTGDVKSYFAHVGLPMEHLKVFAETDDALEWAEDALLEEAGLGRHGGKPLELGEIELFQGLPDTALSELRGCARERRVEAGGKVFSQGDAGDELFVVRRGTVRIVLGLQSGKSFHLASIGEGDFFGDIAFLDRGIRTADALAEEVADVFVLSRAEFDKVAAEHPRLPGLVFERLSRAQAARLRITDRELQVLRET